MINRTIRKLALTDDNTVYIRLSGSSKIIECNALDVERNEQGRPTYLVLDRMIHSPNSDYVLDDGKGLTAGASFFGCYTSELSLSYPTAKQESSRYS